MPPAVERFVSSVSRTSRLAYMGILLGFGIALHAAEAMIPVPFIVPGAKLGLANVVSLIAIVLLGPGDALIIAGIRSVLGSLLGGTLGSLPFSLAGALVSCTLMGLAWTKGRAHFSLPGISVLGGVSHNIAQLFVAALVLGTFGIYSYLPILLAAGTFTGYFVGLVAGFTLRLMRPGPALSDLLLSPAARTHSQKTG